MFLNPFAMVVGGALVSAPILIHLINRMRFKRIRWAAMEFLLKSQKKNRRRLIIEQLILLMLRCLLILLVGFLVARFILQASASVAGSATTHVVLLDDSMSMLDKAPKTQSPNVNCFEEAKEQIFALAKTASEAPSVQNLVVLRMSDRKELFNDRLNDTSLGELKKELDNAQPTLLAIDPTESVLQAVETLGGSRDSKRWLHLVSDFRDRDWGTKPHTEKLHKTLSDLADQGTQITLIDAAVPTRDDGKGKTVDNHSNLALTALIPEKRIAPAGTSIPIMAEVANLGAEPLTSLSLEIFIDGKEYLQAGANLSPLPSPGSSQRYTFEVIFNAPPEGQRSQFHRITARIKDADKVTGLTPDNVRHAAVEIRRKVPTLIVDGDTTVDLNKAGGDSRVVADALLSISPTSNEAVEPVFAAAGVTDAAGTKYKHIEALTRPDLEREFSTIYLLNIEHFRSLEKGKETLPLERLRSFVQNGGNVVFFTGDKVNAEYYNNVLYQENKGLFPVPLAEAASRRLDAKEIEQRRNSNAPKLFVLDRDHQVTRGLYEIQYKIPDLIIPQHTPAAERFLWAQASFHQEGDIKELMTLAELKPLDDAARGQIQRLRERIPIETAPEKYVKLLTKHKKLIENSELGKVDQMYLVAEAIDNMLNDPGEKPAEKDNVSLAEFWNLPEQKELKRDFLDFRKGALYGKPLCLVRKYGKGSVVAVMTSAGTKWSGWSGGPDSGVSSFTFPMFIADLQKYLTRGGDTGSRMLGEKIRFELDPQEYRNEVRRLAQSAEGAADGNADAKDALPGLSLVDTRTGELKNGVLQFSFDNTSKPGIHVFQLSPQKAKAGEYEERWFAFNVDTTTESDLRRAASEEVARNPADASATRAKIKWFKVGESQAVLREKKQDFSESWPLYLIFLLVLIVEQALAVHLSFHTKNNEPAATAVAAAPTRQQAAAAASASS